MLLAAFFFATALPLVEHRSSPAKAISSKKPANIFLQLPDFFLQLLHFIFFP